MQWFWKSLKNLLRINKYPYKNISITSKIEHEKKKHLIAKDNGYNIIKFWSHKPYNSQVESIKKEINESYCKTNS